MAFWYSLWHFGIVYDILVYFMAIWYTYFMTFWYILWSFDIFSPFRYIVLRKIWQPCQALQPLDQCNKRLASHHIFVVCIVLQSRVKIRILQAGWPGRICWVIVFTLGSFLKISKWPNLWGTFFYDKIQVLVLTKKGEFQSSLKFWVLFLDKMRVLVLTKKLRVIFWAIFYKLIWSPCFQASRVEE
jgi:hypothetical protein